MGFLKLHLLFLIAFLFAGYCTTKEQQNLPYQSEDMMVRIAEIELEPEYLDEYKKILQEEAEASLRLEVGVIAIFPMFQKENPASIRILEIYQDRQAYEAHLKTPHFLHYKTNTLHMVKSLNLVEMEAMDPNAMSLIFEKMAR
jgi:4-carboxymuconolactone decarboxylase